MGPESPVPVAEEDPGPSRLSGTSCEGDLSDGVEVSEGGV